MVNSGSAVTMPWADAVKGVIEAWYPGQEDGNAIASLLYGDTNFTGKLPVTFPTALSQGPTTTTAQWPGQNGRSSTPKASRSATAGTTARTSTPMFPFGFGLSYTSFRTPT